jgi:regulatory protein
MGIHSGEREEMIAVLISENFINEERFAVALAGGKFRIKGWGRRKIRNELRKHKLSEYCINKGISSISEKEYLNKIRNLVLKKMSTFNPSLSQIKKSAALYRFMVSRGYEPELIVAELKKLKIDTDELGVEE